MKRIYVLTTAAALVIATAGASFAQSYIYQSNGGAFNAQAANAERHQPNDW